MRLLVNENVTRTVIQELRRRGHDVLSVKESIRSEADDAILARAQREERIAVTHDKDFGELAFRSGLPAACGVVLLRLAGSDPGTDNRRIVEALESAPTGRDTSRSSRTIGFACGRCPMPDCPRRAHDERTGLFPRWPFGLEGRASAAVALQPPCPGRPRARRPAQGRHRGKGAGTIRPERWVSCRRLNSRHWYREPR
jgi:predicted nuclease of predicted toxin-antitoxin system